MLKNYPPFFDTAPTIVVRDPLSRFLGATAHGDVEYHYADAVAFAGHSCPTVAAAFLMTRGALRKLYGDDTPVRGDIRVAWRDDRDAGVTGVMAGVATLLTGAADSGGFKGIGGHFTRRNLLSFNADVGGDVRFTRADTNTQVDVAARLESVPMAPQIQTLMPLCISGRANGEETKQFRDLWQARVKTLLLDHADDPNVIIVN